MIFSGLELWPGSSCSLFATAISRPSFLLFKRIMQSLLQALVDSRPCQHYFFEAASPLLAALYWSALFEWPMTSSFFEIKQHAHLFWKHISSRSWLHMAQVHGWLFVTLLFPLLLCDAKNLASITIHNVTADMPSAKKMRSDLILIRKIRSAMAKRIIAIANIMSQRCVKSIL